MRNHAAFAASLTLNHVSLKLITFIDKFTFGLILADYEGVWEKRIFTSSLLRIQFFVQTFAVLLVNWILLFNRRFNGDEIYDDAWTFVDVNGDKSRIPTAQPLSASHRFAWVV